MVVLFDGTSRGKNWIFRSIVPLQNLIPWFMDGTLNGTDSISVFFFFVKHNLINLDYVLRGYIPLQ